MIANGVILAENDGLMRGIIRSVLLRAECSGAPLQVFPVANGMEAVALARRLPARLVMLDVAMPQLNGLLACKTIRELPGYAHTPIIMLTGYDDERIRDASRQFGATDFVTKPFRPDALLARVAQCLEPGEGAGTSHRDDGTMPGVRAQIWQLGELMHPTGSRRYDVAEGVPPKVWGPRPDPLPIPVPSGREPAPLASGREFVRIVRSVEREP